MRAVPLGRRPRHGRLLSCLLFALVLLAGPVSGESTEQDNAEDETPAVTPTPTTGPIYLPHYDADDWALVRGSVISKDDSANQTTYTIFCPTQTPPACELAMDFPFVVVYGASTVRFQGTVTSTYTVNVGCEFNATTAVTCSGYSSFATDYSNAPRTGPTESSWTSVLEGTDVEWGTLTMAELPTRTADSLGMTVTTASQLPPSNELYLMPEPTAESGAAQGLAPKTHPWTAVVGSGLLGLVLAFF